MKSKKLVISMIAMLMLVIGITIRCGGGKKEGKENTQQTKLYLGVDSVAAEPFPGTAITGINFPENPATINSWINTPGIANNYDSTNIYKHAWGVWAGLTHVTNQFLDGDSIRIFESWLGLSEVQELIVNNTLCVPLIKRSGRAPLTRPKQFEHTGLLATSLSAQKQVSTGPSNAVPANGFWVTVSYDPSLACDVVGKKVFKQSYINKFFNAGQVGAIPSLVKSSIAIKPTYLVYPDTAQLLQMPVWTSPPNPPGAVNAFGGPPNFPAYVYVDVNNGQTPFKALTPIPDTTTVFNSTMINNATCNLSDFISFNVNQSMANFMNLQDSVQGLSGSGRAAAGQRALLVAMHVTTKEITNWTWQTFYWSPTPTTPGAPGSNLSAGLMPPQVKGAARHYAANAAYVMTTPNNSSLPTAGNMSGYNPYLEGGFGGTGVFGIANTQFPSLVWGMQSNCMSCHALATPPPTPNAPNYCTDQYIDTNSTAYFGGQVRLDFLWSIQTALIADTVPYWQFTAAASSKTAKTKSK